MLEERTIESIGPVRGTGCVLLVEDEEAVRVLVTRMLKALGYDVFVASSPAEAVGLFALNADEITVLLTDVVMPQVGGRELAERLSADAPGLRVAVHVRVHRRRAVAPARAGHALRLHREALHPGSAGPGPTEAAGCVGG